MHATNLSTVGRLRREGWKMRAQFALAMHMVSPAGFLLLRRGLRVVLAALEALRDETI